MNEPRWIDQRALLLLHSASLAEHGGLESVRDEALLESALNRPRNKFTYENKCDVFDLAAAYGFALARNHPFHDGNKRIAFLAVGLFLAINNYRLVADQLDAIQKMVSLAAGQLTEKSFADWVRKHAVKYHPSPEHESEL
jgi:death-on-curing protein